MNESYTRIAEAAGVSLSTVSRVMRDLPGPSSKTRELVLRVASRLGYSPGISTPASRFEILIRYDTRSLRNNQVWADPFYGLVFEGVESRAKALGLRVGMVRSPGDTHPYGVLFVGHAVEETLQELLESRVPVVLVDEDEPHFDRVISQNIMGAQQAADHLLEAVPASKGIAVVSGPLGRYSYPRRVQGFIATLEEARRYRSELVFRSHEALEDRPGFDQRAGRWAAQKIAKRLDEIGGVFVYNDACAISLLDELAILGVEVPQQVKVVGFDDDALASHARVPLTTVRVDHHAMGEWAVNLLLRRLEEPKRSPVQVAVTAELIPRQSTGHEYKPDPFKGVSEP